MSRLVAASVVLLGLLGFLVGAGGASAPRLTPLRLVPNAVAFWDQRHGLIGTGNETFLGSPDQQCENNICHPGTISSTSDGGVTSRVLVQTPGPVTRLAVARPGQAWAVVHVCERDRCSDVLWHSVDAGRRWSVIGSAPFQLSFVDGRHGFGLTPAPSRTADGGRTWHALRSPCPAGGTGAISFVSAIRGWILCLDQPGTGNQGKSLYRTDDGAEHWKFLAGSRLVTSGMRQYFQSSGGLDGYGYPRGIAFASDGLGVIWESRGTLYLTHDGGRHWKSYSKVAVPEADFGLSASVVPGRAFVLLSRTPHRPMQFRLVTTTNVETGWHTARIWTAPIR